MGTLAERVSRWYERYREWVKKHPERKGAFTNLSGFSLKPLYAPLEAEEAGYLDRLGFPGEYPFTRGIYPSMYRTKLWTKRLLIGYESPETLNRRQKEMLTAGQDALNIVPCNSHFRGYDADQIERGVVGTCGTPISTLEDMEVIFDGLPLDRVSIALNDAGPFTLAAMTFALAQEQGIPLAQLRGTTNQADFISHSIGCKMMFRFSFAGHLRMLVDHVKYCTEHLPMWNPVSIVGQHMQQGGATPLQELAFTLSTGIFYVDECVKAGLSVDDIAPRFTFFFDVTSSLFEEVAKVRAARRMWAKIMRERFGAQNSRSLWLKTHAQTSGVELTEQQPLNNLARICLQALAAVLGGVQSLHTDAYDEALNSPTEEAARLALMIQHIIAEESGVADVVDPLGGSYYVEALTDQMEERAWEYIKKIDALGGMLEAVRCGYIQAEIERSALEYQRAIDRKERVRVGVNEYLIPAEQDYRPEAARPRPVEVEKHLERLRQFKLKRDLRRVKTTLHALREAANNTQVNLFAAVIEAVKAHCTHGEIVAELRDVYGYGRPL